jgi:hydrogenase/urease accessory protein HupE
MRRWVGADGALTRRFVFVLFLAIAALSSRSASAHSVGLSLGEYRVAGETVTASLVFTSAELSAALPDIDADRDGRISPGELSRAKGVLEPRLAGATEVSADGTPCAPGAESEDIEGDAIHVQATFACGHPPRRLAIRCGFIERFSEGHRHLATVLSGGKESSFVLVRARPQLQLDLGAAPSRATFWPMVWTGMTHIWTGYDHLAFLFGLLLVGGSIRAIVGVISAFTVAHSITLALAVLHIVTVPPSIVEPAIALSIVYVAIENLVVRSPGQRWRITFPFGLIHGFGFAGALTELDLPPARVPAALFAFNVGVEIGQLAVVAVVLPLVVRARRNASFRRWGVPALSAALACAGLVWFVWRVGI